MVASTSKISQGRSCRDQGKRKENGKKKKEESVGDLILISTIYLSNTNAYINSNLNHFSELWSNVTIKSLC